MKHLPCVAHGRGLGMHVAEICLFGHDLRRAERLRSLGKPYGMFFGGLFPWIALVLCLIHAPKGIFFFFSFPDFLWLSPHAVPGSFRNKIIIVCDL